MFFDLLLKYWLTLPSLIDFQNLLKTMQILMPHFCVLHVSESQNSLKKSHFVPISQLFEEQHPCFYKLMEHFL